MINNNRGRITYTVERLSSRIEVRHFRLCRP